MFSSSYTEARDKFREAAKKAQFALRTYTMAQRGPANEELSTDVACLMAYQTKKLLIITSGVHGPEGYAGSAAQIQLLSQLNQQNRALLAKQGVSIVLVHAANPHGMAYDQRVDRSLIVNGITHNVDPNRNFIDHKNPPPNPGYTLLENIIVPYHWSWWTAFTTTAHLFFYYLLDTIYSSYSNFWIPVLSAQYTSPEGFSFGGNSPSWTNRVINQTIQDLELESLPGLEKVVCMDLHTGLGNKYTCGVIPCEVSRKSVSTALNDIKDVNIWIPPYPATGTLDEHMQRKFRGREVISFTAELGTERSTRVLNALRARATVNRYGADPAQEKKVAREMRLAFYPEDPAWRSKALTLINDITHNVFEHLLEVKISPELTQLMGKWHSMFQSEESRVNQHRDPLLAFSNKF